MSKNANRKRNPRTSTQQALKASAKQLPPKQRASIFSRIVALIGLIGSIGTIATCLAPGVSISTGVTLDATDPFAQRLVVTNGGWLPLTNVRFEWHPNSVLMMDKGKEDLLFREMSFDEDPILVGSLSAKQSTTVKVPMRVIMLQGAVRNVDITTRVSGNLLWLLPIWPHIEHFTAMRDVQGGISWSPRNGSTDLMTRPESERHLRLDIKNKWGW
jgi:hypothetical protein